MVFLEFFVIGEVGNDIKAEFFEIVLKVYNLFNSFCAKNSYPTIINPLDSIDRINSQFFCFDIKGDQIFWNGLNNFIGNCFSYLELGILSV